MSILAGTVILSIPLNRSVKDLSLDEKYHLWELLEEQIAQIEEEERDPSVQAEIDAARREYQAGNYETLDKYIVR